MTKKTTAALLIASTLLGASCSHHGMMTGQTPAQTAFVEERGVKIESVRLSAKGRMIDLRYRILDSEKAKGLTDKKHLPYLINESTGAVMTVPAFPMIGMLRQASSLPQQGRTFFILFENAASMTKKGDRVTVVIGGFKATGLTVE